MKERHRKQQFLKHFCLAPIKNPKPVELDTGDDNVCERLCFYYFDDDGQVTCRGCYSRFKTWLMYRMHFNGSCHITETNYKLNTYNDVYKKYKLRKAKTKKKINDRLSAAQLMDLETLNTRKTRKRCYTNTWVVLNNMPIHSSLDTGSSTSEISVKMEIGGSSSVSSSESSGVEEAKPNTIYRKTVQRHIPYSTNDETSSLPQDNQPTLPIKQEWNADDISSDDQYSSSGHSDIKYEPKENKSSAKYVCVICDDRFSNKCSLTLHQVQHIKENRSTYGLFAAALARTA